jgi:integrase
MSNIINMLWDHNDWRTEYRYGLYGHKLIAPSGEVYTRRFIVVKNRFGLIAHFTALHNYVGVYDGKVFAPLVSDAEAKLLYVCMMLNYVMIKHYDRFRIDHVFRITRDALECFFRDYAQEKLANGGYRGKQSIEKCINTVTMFFRKLRRKFGPAVLLTESDLVTEALGYDRRGRPKSQKRPAFQAKGFISHKKAFRDLPTKMFQILLSLAFRYAPDIAFAMCLQAFAGLRAGEVCNVRQEGSPSGNGLIFTCMEGEARKIEIDLTRELPMRGDGVFCARIKKERTQCVYPAFLGAFRVAYERHKAFLATRRFETAYCPMFVNKKGLAMTCKDYARRFRALADSHFRPALLESDDPECRIYGQLLHENRLTSHALRHWFSVQLVLRGENIAQIQYWRGDDNPTSAFEYLQNKGDLVNELKRAGGLLADLLIERGKIGGDESDGI